MKYTKVKTFWTPIDENSELEKQINEFLDKDEVVDLVDIKYTTNSSGKFATYEAMVIYRAMPIG